MAAKLTRITHRIAIQLHLLAERCTICSCRSRRHVQKIWIHPRIHGIEWVDNCERSYKKRLWKEVIVVYFKLLVGPMSWMGPGVSAIRKNFLPHPSRYSTGCCKSPPIIQRH